MSFDFECGAKLVTPTGESAVPLDGLVFADAESSGAEVRDASGSLTAQKEYVRATPAGNATWRILETWKTAGCPSNALGDLQGSTLTLRTSGQECSSLMQGAGGPTAVAFMQGVTKANVEFQGRGASAVALGYVMSLDYGDAPNAEHEGHSYGYGMAGALFEPAWSGGILASPTGTNLETHAKATLSDSSNHLYLGKKVSSNRVEPYPEDSEAKGDAPVDGSASDEDAVAGLKLPASLYTEQAGQRTDTYSIEVPYVGNKLGGAT